MRLKGLWSGSGPSRRFKLPQRSVLKSGEDSDKIERAEKNLIGRESLKTLKKLKNLKKKK